MRVLCIHNYYQQPGGEDQVFAAETALLERHGHEVVRYTQHNESITGMNPMSLAGKTLWSQQAYRDLRGMIRATRPDVAHFHNTFPLVSPAGYYAAHAEGVPVVQTLHNYRLTCPSAVLYRDGGVCEECLGRRVAWPALAHRCYRESRLTTGGVVAMLASHRLLRTWSRTVDLYIAPTELTRAKLVEGGLPPEKIAVKPNFLEPDPGAGNGQGEYVLFVGRLTPEKGVRTLLAAWERLGDAVPLKIVGDGALEQEVADAARRGTGIEWLGRCTNPDVLRLMRDAAALVFPSEWYEGLPHVIIEAFASGTPVIASDVGAMHDLIRHGETGLHARPGDADDLVHAVRWFHQHPEEHARFRRNTRREYEERYTGQCNHALLMGCYARVCGRFNAGIDEYTAELTTPSAVSPPLATARANRPVDYEPQRDATSII